MINSEVLVALMLTVINSEKLVALVLTVIYSEKFLCFVDLHLSIILDNDQVDTHLLYFTIGLFNPLHASSIIFSSSGG